MMDEKSKGLPKWPFFLGDVLLLGAAYFIYAASPRPLGPWEIVAFGACVAFGAALGVWPFVLEHQTNLKSINNTLLGSATEKLQDLGQVAAQITAATNEWQNVQLQSEKISGVAREITDRIAAESRQFAEFMQQANDTEKATLRLEVEKLRRAEGEWLQVVIRMLDHVHALFSGAVRSGQPRVAEQIQQFQNACHDAARRVGLVPFGAQPGDPFDAQRHQTPTGEPPAADAKIGETLAAGFTYQGRMLRPALVRPAEAAPEVVEPEAGEAQLSLESPGPS